MYVKLHGEKKETLNEEDIKLKSKLRLYIWERKLKCTTFIAIYVIRTKFIRYSHWLI